LGKCRYGKRHQNKDNRSVSNIIDSVKYSISIVLTIRTRFVFTQKNVPDVHFKLLFKIINDGMMGRLWLNVLAICVTKNDNKYRIQSS
jgi:hypothetical protein